MDAPAASFIRRPWNRLFWKIGSVYLLLLVGMLVALDTYVVRGLRQEYLTAAFAQLESLAHVALVKIPSAARPPSYRDWAAWLAHGGMRVTFVAADGVVLADSEEDVARMQNHGDRPEIRDALARGYGRAVRTSDTLQCDQVYLAQRFYADGRTPRILRLSLPLHRLNAGVHAFRRRLLGASALILVLTGGVSLMFFRTTSNRIRRLKEFSGRVARGDFRPMPRERSHDELTDLSDTLNQTAATLDRTIHTLTEERTQSAAILSSMEEGVVVVDSDQRVLFCNRAFFRAVEIPEADYQGRPVVELVHHPDMMDLFHKTLFGDAIARGEITVGSVRTRSYAVTAAPIRSASAIAGAVMVLHDITEIRRLERARRDFVANISHEFRTPLTAIQGFAETLLEGALEDAANGRRFLRIIHEHALRLGRLTEDLLKLARIEAGQLAPEMQPVAIDRILESCLETCRIKAGQKNLTVEADYASAMPLLNGDARLLQEVLQNLLENAIRYTGAGGRICMKASVRGSEMEISVADTGIGIPRADQQRIFERFYRADAARSRESGGTGLGLSIAKHLVEAHGGRIRVESEVGRGSTFYVYLPL